MTSSALVALLIATLIFSMTAGENTSAEDQQRNHNPYGNVNGSRQIHRGLFEAGSPSK